MKSPQRWAVQAKHAGQWVTISTHRTRRVARLDAKAYKSIVTVVPIRIVAAPVVQHRWQDYALHGKEMDAIHMLRTAEGLDLKTAAQRVLRYKNSGGRCE